MTKKERSYEKYWDENISRWGDLYLKISHGHETLEGSKIVGWIYNRVIVPYESYLMKIRYQKTIDFIEEYVKDGITVNDIGCGTGIFSVECLMRGAKVNALDISQTSLDQTSMNIEAKCPQLSVNIFCYKYDVQKEMPPESDCTICVGVMPYIDDTESFLENLLTPTRIAFIQFSSSNSPSNVVRRVLPFLNVRRLKFQTEKTITEIADGLGFNKISSNKFATGGLLIFQKRE